VIGRWLSIQVTSGAAVVAGWPPPHHVEVDPPEAEADRQGDHPGHDDEPVAVGRGQAVDDAEDHLAEDDDREQTEPLHQRVGGRQARAGDREAADQREAHQPADAEARPDGEPRHVGEDGAGRDQRHRHGHAEHVAAGRGEELGVVPAVLAPDAEP
jgi:hypothetical protein